MVPIYAYHDYKEYLRAAADHLKVTFAKIAESGGIHRQYLSQVLNGKANLTDDQAYAIGRYFRLSEEETLYFLLLLQEAKAARPETKKFLRQRREAIQARKNKLSAKLPNETEKVQILDDRRSDFYLDLKLQLCHSHFFVPAYQKNPAQVMAKLRLSPEEFEHCLERLLQWGMMEKNGKQLRSKQAFTHLEKNSLVSQQNHRNWRAYAATLPSLSGPDRFHFSSTVTSEKKNRLELVRRLEALIAEFHRELPGTADEEVFQVNFDVFAI